MTTLAPLAQYDGVAVGELAARAGVPALEAWEAITSTLDRAHLLGASGAAAGSAIVAEAQAAGRGRLGRPWQSAPGQGVWLTVLERPDDVAAIGVLALRCGLALAEALAPWAPGPVALKWPNDLWAAGGKLAGVLIEARWRGAQPEWVAIGVGINTSAECEGAAPAPRDGEFAHPATRLVPGASRAEVLVAALAAVRAAAAARGELSAGELAAWEVRDLAHGRQLAEPRPGRAAGLRPDGALLVETDAGVAAVLSGSLRFA
jgi:BirA family biotin operon repressor/biotin-[acetyl-CoA-carboxylase] ligase